MHGQFLPFSVFILVWPLIPRLCSTYSPLLSRTFFSSSPNKTRTRTRHTGSGSHLVYFLFSIFLLKGGFFFFFFDSFLLNQVSLRGFLSFFHIFSCIILSSISYPHFGLCISLSLIEGECLWGWILVFFLSFPSPPLLIVRSNTISEGGG